MRFIALLALALFANAGHAASTCKGGPKAQWKTPAQAQEAAAAKGYTKALKVIVEDGCYEVVTLNGQGKIVGVQLDPVTLAIAKVEAPR